MHSVKWYLLHCGILVLGLLMCSLALAEFASRRILNLKADSSFTETTTVQEVPLGESIDFGISETTTVQEVSLLHGGTIAFGILFFLGGGVLLLYGGGALCASCLEEDKSESTNSNNNGINGQQDLPDWCTTKKLKYASSLLDNLPAGWDMIEIPSKQSAIITAEVENLFHDTWQYNERIGRDATNLKHKSLKIQEVCIVHNGKSISNYLRNTESFKVHGLQKPKGRFTRLTSVKGQSEPLTWSSSLGAALHELDTSLPDTCRSINEIYLFHGTKNANIKGILDEGFSLAKSSVGLYGKALYFAESSEKSDQYTDHRDSRRTEKLCMLLVRVTLGRIYVHGENVDSHLNHLPCTKRYCFTPGCAIHSEKFNSAVAGLDKRFREYLLYDSHQCYPHVLVFYDRKDNGQEQKAFAKCSIPCYVVGPKSEVQHFEYRKPDNLYWEVETEKNRKMSDDFDTIDDESLETPETMSSESSNSHSGSESDIEIEKIVLRMYKKNHMEREHKLNHIAALSKHVPTSECSLDNGDDSLQTDKIVLTKIREYLKKTNLKIDRLVETLNRSYILSSSVSQTISDQIDEEVSIFTDLFTNFNSTFKIWRTNHENCSIHRG